MNDLETVKRTVDILDEFGARYSHESVGKTDNYLTYVQLAKKAKKADEEKLIQPTIFHIFGGDSGF